ncbi:MAG: hypothetical protein GY862_30670 [Gammaproteobacteria bacterium]|nr:hypothetical protein [Gammaproteobacteria bacterium]
MSNEKRLQQEIARLEKRYHLLTDKLNAIEQQKDSETRVEEKLRSQEIIDQTEEDRAKVENKISELEE